MTTEGDGTLESPYTAADALALIAANAFDPEAEVYVKGTISQIDEYNIQYGNATYWISEDGTTTSQFQIYRGKFIDGEEFTEENQIMVGDKVVVKGKLVLYGETKPQMATGSQIVTLDVVTERPVVQPADLTIKVADMITAMGVTVGSNGYDLTADYEYPLNEDLKVTFTHGNTNTRFWNDNTIRMYQNATFKVVSTKNVEKIEYVCLSGKKGPLTVDSGAMDDVVWTGDAAEILFTVAGNQIRISEIKVTYKK